MKKHLFCYCCTFLIGLIAPSWACLPYTADVFFGSNPYGIIAPLGLESPEVEPPQPSVQDPAYLLRAFFARFLFSETALEEMVGLALIQGVSCSDHDELMRLLFQRFSFLGNPLNQAVNRMQALTRAGIAPFNAFARALFEGMGFSASQSAARIMGLLTNATLLHDVEAAFWSSVFEGHGFTEAQALRAFHVMQAYLGQGFSCWKAFCWAMFSQFHFNEATIRILNAYQERLVMGGMPSHLAFYQALFSPLEYYGPQIQAMGMQAFNARIQAGEPLVAAYYATRFGFAGFTHREIQQATARLIDVFADEHYLPYWGNAYAMVLYEAFGFPQALARAMAEVNQHSFVCLGPQANPVHVFWGAAFRVLGVPEEELEEARAYFVAYRNQGYQPREAFERAFLQLLVCAGELEAVTQAFLNARIAGAGTHERLRFLLYKAWGARYPWVATETLEDAIQGFFDSPSTLSRILGFLGGFQ